MKMGFAISITEKDKKQSLCLSSVAGSGLRKISLVSSEHVPFSFDSQHVRGLSQYLNTRILSLFVDKRPTQKRLPVYVAIQPSVAESAGTKPGLESYNGLCSGLGLAFTQMLKAHLGKKGNFVVRPSTFMRSDVVVEKHPSENEELPNEREIRQLVDSMDQASSFEQLKQRAYQDGQDVMEFNKGKLGDINVSDFRFSLWGRQYGRNIRFTYLNAHPEIKDAFVRGLMSKKPAGQSPHHFCIKTMSDKHAPQLTDIVSTCLADEIAEDHGITEVCHVQTLLPDAK